jgi:hypothetical protein
MQNYTKLMGAFILIFLLFASGLFAKDKKEKQSLSKPLGDPNETTSKVHNMGTLWNAQTNYGICGDANAGQTGRPSMEWPGGSRVQYLWEGRFWFGAIVGGEFRCSHADYGNYELYPTIGSSFDIITGANSRSMEDFVVTYDDLNKTFHSTQPIGIKVIERNLVWALPDFDDIVAYEYELINVSGTILNDFIISFVYDNDVGAVADVSNPHIDDVVDFDGWDGLNSDTDTWDIVENIDIDGDEYGVPNNQLDGYDDWGIPYGLEFVGSPTVPYPYYDPAKIHTDGFYDEYTVLPDENGPYLHWQSDVPEANPPRIAGEYAVVGTDTLRGYCVPRNMSYMYDGDDPASGNWDTGERDDPSINRGEGVLGFIGGALIYTDHLPYVESIEDTLRRVYSHQWWNWESDPGSDKEKYEYMIGGHTLSAGRKFMPRPFESGAPVFDYRWMTTSGPFNDYYNNDTLRVVYVAAVGEGLRGLRQNIDNALWAYYSGSTWSNPYKPSDFVSDVHWSLPVPPAVPNLVYSPYEEGQGTVLAWDDIAEKTPDPKLGIIDFQGYRVYRARYAPRDWQIMAQFDNVDMEVTVYNANGDSIGRANLPDIQYTMIDTGGTFVGTTYSQPVNGLPYYYAVTAYDPIKTELNLPSIESPKTNFKTDLATGAPVPVIPTILYETHQETYDLSLIKVVPNPYRGYSELEERYQEKIMFQNLPPACKLSIFTMTGDLVIAIDHNDGSGQELWDLISRNNQAIKAGLYIYVIETEDDKNIGKFVILR